MSRSRHHRTVASSDSASDSGSDSREQPVQEAQYQQLGLAAALRRPADFATATSELAAIVRHLYAGHCSKAVQALVVEDVALAIACCDGRMQSRSALAALMEAAERVLPQSKRNALLRQYRQSSVQLQRRQRRGSGGGGAAAWSNDEEESQAPATFDHLPPGVMEQVFATLDPISLARCACVNREWQVASAEDGLWQPHCARLLGGSSARQQQQQQQQQAGISEQGGRQGGSGHGSGLYRQQFAAAARQHPEWMLPWRTNRVMARHRPAWLPEGQQQRHIHTARCLHVSTAAVLAWLKSGGSRRGSVSGSSGSSGSSDDGISGEGEDGRVSRRLRFWQL